MGIRKALMLANLSQMVLRWASSLDCIDGMDNGRPDGVANSLGCSVGQWDDEGSSEGCSLGLLDSKGFIERWLLSPEDGIGVLGVSAGCLPLPLPPPLPLLRTPPLVFHSQKGSNDDWLGKGSW